MTKQHVEAMGEVIDWLAREGADPLMLGVMEDARERVAQRAKNAALVRIRMMNAGTPPAERARRARRAVPRTPAEAKQCGPRWEWSVEEMDRLRELFGENLSFATIGEMLGRTGVACRAQAARMGIHRPHPYGERAGRSIHLVHYNTGGPLSRAKAVMDERRRREMRQRREEMA